MSKYRILSHLYYLNNVGLVQLTVASGQTKGTASCNTKLTYGIHCHKKSLALGGNTNRTFGELLPAFHTLCS